MEKISSIFYKPETWFEITINPRDQLQDKPFRTEKVVGELKKLLLRLFTKGIYTIMYPEYSEPTELVQNKYPRLHFHGVIYFTQTGLHDFFDKYSFILASYGSVKISDLRLDYWMAYCTKQRCVMRPMFKQRRISYPLTYVPERDKKSISFLVDPKDDDE